jgi:hypothetical protein
LIPPRPERESTRIERSRGAVAAAYAESNDGWTVDVQGLREDLRRRHIRRCRLTAPEARNADDASVGLFWGEVMAGVRAIPA